VNIAIPTPPPKSLPVEVKHKPKQTPQRDQPHVRHNRRHKPALLHPRRDEFRKPIPPDVLVDRDSNHERAGDGLVRVDGVGGEHARESGDLDAGAGVADNDDGLPVPFVLVAEGDDEVAEHHYEDVGDWIERRWLAGDEKWWIFWREALTHSRQSHLRLTNTAVPPRRSRADPITQRTRGRKPDQRADQNCKVHEPNTLAIEVVRRRGEVLALGQVDCQERAARPRDDESCELDDGECEQLPWDPQVEEDCFEGVRVGLVELPLLLAWGAFAEEGIAFGGRLLAEVGHGGFGGDMGDVASLLFWVSITWL